MTFEITSAFRAIGADVHITNEKFPRRQERHSGEFVYSAKNGRERSSRVQLVPILVDVKTEKNHERFEINFDGRGALPRIVDCDRARRHLLLSVRLGDERRADKYLFGRDERHWFAAAVPNERVFDVDSAMEALMPQPVRNELDRLGVAGRARYQRKTAAFVRQGEWFFVPTNLTLTPSLRDEPLQRTGSAKPHVLSDAHRIGGEPVFVCRARDLTLSATELEELTRKKSTARWWGWKRMFREPELYARGAIRHPDHATLRLGVWHRVFVNEEHRAPARSSLAFLD